MEKKNLIEWCQRAAKEIRYRPDREAVTTELYHHLEDRYDALIGKGLSPEEAEKQALDAMGSAQELAPQLAAVHRPWLGYLYRLVRALAVIFAICAIYLWGMNIGSFVHTWVTTRNFDAIPANHTQLDQYWQPNVSDWCDGYRFEVTEAGYSEADAAFYFDLQITYAPWMDPCVVSDHIWAVDSLGNYYESRVDAEYGDPTRVTGTGGMSSPLIYLYNKQIQGFDCDAEWVELHYDRDGRDLVLRIEIPGGEDRG